MRKLLPLLLILLAGCQSSSWRRPAEAPFQIGFWYWSSPFQFSPSQVEKLAEAKASRLLVRAFTLSYDGERVVPILGQRFEPAAGLPPIVLVANLDAGMVRHFKEANPDAMLKTTVSEFQDRQKRAESAGHKVIGWQLDFDVPTSQLPKYATLLEGVRKECRTELSISGLQTWMGSPELARALKPLDAWYPQFYEGRLPDSPTDRQTLSNLTRDAERVARFGKPFWIGIASYESCIAFDPTGKRAGIVRGISLNDAGQRFKEEQKWVSATGEVGASFRVTEGPRKGWSLRISAPSLASVKADIQLARETGAVGVSIFRLPSEVDRTALPVASLAAAWLNSPSELKIEVSRTSSRIPVYAMIENPSDGPEAARQKGQTRREFTIKNAGNISSEKLTIRVDGLSKMDTVNRGDFRPIRQNQQYDLYGLSPGDSAHFGPIIYPDDRQPKFTLEYRDATGKPKSVEMK